MLCIPAADGRAQRDAASAAETQARHLYAEALRLEKKNHLAEAQSALAEAHTLVPGDVPVEIALGKLDSVLGRMDDAIELFRSVEAAHPSDPENAINLAIALASKGSLAEALVFANVAVKGNPHTAGSHHIRGKILADMGRAADAEAEYKSALAISPADPLTLYDFAIFCEAAGRPDDEVLLLRRLIKVRPDASNDHFLLGRALLRVGDRAGAQTAFREAIRLDPNNRAGLYNLSRLLQQENPAEAAQLAARFRALKLSEEERNGLRDRGNRGVQAMQAHDWPAAIATFQAALALCAGCALEATFEKDLGLAQCESGDTAAGAASLRRSFALDPNDMDVLKAIELAESGVPGEKK